MTILTMSDLSAAEIAAIKVRVDRNDSDIAFLESQRVVPASQFENIADLDTANARSQKADIEELVTFLQPILAARDISEPGNVPHYVQFVPPNPGTPSFPVVLPDLDAATVLATYIAAIPDYPIPFTEAQIDGNGWALGRAKDPGPGNEADPNSLSAGEGASITAMNDEFLRRQAERLHTTIGSYTISNAFVTGNTKLDLKITLLTQRNLFWKGIGF